MRTSLKAMLAAAILTVSMLPGGAIFAQPVEEVAVEEILAFSVDVAVREDGTVLIAERIEYAFPEERHGIYRDIPTRYRMDGKTVLVPVEVMRVTMDGEDAPYEVDQGRNAVRIKIGDPDETVSGVRSYLITYVVRGALRYFPDHDELYWNVTGNTWTVPIRRASATVRAPQAAAGDITHTCYTGPTGSTAQDCLSRAEGHTASFVAEGSLTIVVGWKPGLVATLLPVVDEWYQPRYLWPLALPFIAFFFLFRRWQKRGRDPKGRGTSVVQYDPPDGLSPAEVGGLIDERVSGDEIVATMTDLAVRGHLKFVETDDDLRLERRSDVAALSTLQPYERKIMETSFASGSTVSVSEIKEKHLFEGVVQKIAKDIDVFLTEKGYFPKDLRTTPVAYGVTGAIVAFAGVAMFFGSIEIGWSTMMAGAIALFVTGAIALLFAKPMVRRTEKGVLAREHALGFKEYLEKAEKYRLQWQEKEGIFEKFLPYAMVFGVADKWTKAFAGFDLPKPDWYDGKATAGGHLNAALLAGSLSSLQKDTVTAVMATTPAETSGSGFSGGSSGGGGGGGGGGSW